MGKGNNQTKALNGITFQVMAGEFLGIMGSSGSGKSTLLNCIATVIRPTGGRIRMRETDVHSLRGADLAEYRGKKISLLFDGVYKNSQVWCNSYYLGKQAQTDIFSFTYDITEQFSFDRENVICVCADHRDIADSAGSPVPASPEKVQLLVQGARTCDPQGAWPLKP